MNALIIGTLITPLAVQITTDVGLYGTVSAAAESLDNDTNRTTEVSNSHSVLGIKGSTNLADDLKGLFLFDTFFLAKNSGNNGNGSLYSEGYVDLQGDFGTIALGYHGRPWKALTNGMDIFGNIK